MSRRWGFDLSMSAVRLMQHESGEWKVVATEKIDSEDIEERLGRLIDRVDKDEPVDLFLPRDQILYADVPIRSVETAAVDVASQMEGRTPYNLSELELDWELVDGASARVAAIAKETLDEAAAFAEQRGLLVGGFSSLAEQADFPRNPDFGGAPDLLTPAPDLAGEELPPPFSDDAEGERSERTVAPEAVAQAGVLEAEEPEAEEISPSAPEVEDEGQLKGNDDDADATKNDVEVDTGALPETENEPFARNAALEPTAASEDTEASPAPLTAQDDEQDDEPEKLHGETGPSALKSDDNVEDIEPDAAEKAKTADTDLEPLSEDAEAIEAVDSAEGTVDRTEEQEETRAPGSRDTDPVIADVPEPALMTARQEDDLDTLRENSTLETALATARKPERVSSRAAGSKGPVLQVDDSKPVMQFRSETRRKLDPGPALDTIPGPPRVRTDIAAGTMSHQASSLRPTSRPRGARPVRRARPMRTVAIFMLAVLLTIGIAIVVWSILPLGPDRTGLAQPSPEEVPASAATQETVRSDMHADNENEGILREEANPVEIAAVAPLLPGAPTDLDDTVLPDLDFSRIAREAVSVPAAGPIDTALFSAAPVPSVAVGTTPYALTNVDGASLTGGGGAPTLSSVYDTSPVRRDLLTLASLELDGVPSALPGALPPGRSTIEATQETATLTETPEPVESTKLPESPPIPGLMRAVTPLEFQGNLSAQLPSVEDAPEPEAPATEENDVAPSAETDLQFTSQGQPSASLDQALTEPVERILPTLTSLARRIPEAAPRARPDNSVSPRETALIDNDVESGILPDREDDVANTEPIEESTEDDGDRIALASADHPLAGKTPRARPQSVEALATLEVETSESSLLSASPTPRPRPYDTASLAADTARAAAAALDFDTPDTSNAVRAALSDEIEPEPAPRPQDTPAIVTLPSKANVAQQATVANAISLSKINLIGVYGLASDRRALVRLSSGKFVKVKVGDRIDGGTVAQIDDTELRYRKGGRIVSLQMPKG